MSSFTIQAKWQGSVFNFSLPSDASVQHLQQECMRQAGLETCKIIGLVKGKLPDDPNTLISSFHPPGSTIKLMLIGVAGGGLKQLGEQESVYEARRIEEAQRLEAERIAYESLMKRESEEREIQRVINEQRVRERAEQQRLQQAEWEERRRREEAARIEQEIKSEQNKENVCTFELHSFHSPSLDNTDSATKILMPPETLQTIINQKISFPLLFQLSKPESGTELQQAAVQAQAAFQKGQEEEERKQDEQKLSSSSSFSLTSEAVSDDHASIAAASASSSTSSASFPIVHPLCTYAGVGDFTAPPHTVLLPLSIMRRLNLTDGSILRLQSLNLLPATFIQLLPLTPQWTQLPEIQRRALLEFQLRKRTFIQQDGTLSFNYHPHLPPFQFRVVDCKLQPVVSIINADIPTEILPFELPPGADTAVAPMNIDSSSSSSSSSSASSSSPPAFVGLPPSPTKLVSGESIAASIPTADSSIIYSYEVTDPNQIITISVTALTGDPDLYILTSDSIGSQVDVCNYTWCAQNKGNVELQVSASDPLFHLGNWQIMVRAYGAPAEFKIMLRETPISVSSSSSSFSSSSSSSITAASSSSTSSSSTAPPPPDSTLCTNCKSLIPTKSYTIHSMQCARLNTSCDKCGVALKTIEREKHMKLVHGVYGCICGVTGLDQSSMVLHKRANCSLRLVPCLYCPLQLIVADRGQHQFECGTLTSHCGCCGRSIQRKLIRRHLVKEHGGINGKTDEREIQVEDFWH